MADPVLIGGAPQAYNYDQLTLNPAKTILYGFDGDSGMFRLTWPGLQFMDGAGVYWIPETIEQRAEWGLCCDPDGNIYYSQSEVNFAGGFTVFKVTPAGVITTFATYPGNSFPAPGDPTDESVGTPTLVWSTYENCLYGFVDEGAFNIGCWLARITPGVVEVVLGAANSDGSTVPPALEYMVGTELRPVVTPDGAVWFFGPQGFGASEYHIYRYDPTTDTTGHVTSSDGFLTGMIAHCDNTMSLHYNPVVGSEIRIRYQTDMSSAVDNPEVAALTAYVSHTAHDASYSVFFNFYDVYEWECSAPPPSWVDPGPSSVRVHRYGRR